MIVPAVNMKLVTQIHTGHGRQEERPVRQNRDDALL